MELTEVLRGDSPVQRVDTFAGMAASVGGPEEGEARIAIVDASGRAEVPLIARGPALVSDAKHPGGRQKDHSFGNGSFSGILSANGASPRIIRVAAPVSFRYQSEGNAS